MARLPTELPNLIESEPPVRRKRKQTLVNPQRNITHEEATEIKQRGAVAEERGTPPPPQMMKVDLHCHTEASHDCITPLTAIPQRCQEQGIQIQAITDHDQIWGGQQLKALVEQEAIPNLTVIVGEEISTAEGEIIGLFLQERVAPGLTPEETVRQIRAQNGLVLLPHGFDPLKRFRLQPAARERITREIDIVETFNARISRPHWNRVAVSWCEEQGVLMSAGSDAHRLVDIGAAWVEVPRRPINGPADLLLALEKGVPMGNWTHPVKAFLLKMWEQLRNRLYAARS